MERAATIIEAYDIMKNNIIGPNEIINKCKDFLDVKILGIEIPEIPFSIETLLKYSDSHTLILVNPHTNLSSLVSIKYFKDYFGSTSRLKEPCFYNQDWYESEYFFVEESLNYGWVLIKNNLDNESRGIVPELNNQLPTALLCTYVFFVSYFCLNTIFWKYDYVWCNNCDNSGDQIYVGRYIDSNGLSSNGYSIHRHLSVKMNYGYFKLV
jgi:hypothetical protein